MTTLKDRKKNEAERKLKYYRQLLLNLPANEKEKLKECELAIKKYERILFNIEGYKNNNNGEHKI